MGFYQTGSSGTVIGPNDFDPEEASKKLFDGMKGLGTDENAIVEVIGGHTNEQRQEIKSKFKTMYGKDLMEELESELGGSFLKIVAALMCEPEAFIIECINQAISGVGTDEYTLIGLLCTRTNKELEEMKKAYKEKYEKEMEEDVAEDLSGDFRSLIVGIINGGREENESVDLDKVAEDVKNLQDASEGAGTREEVFQSIFNQRSYEHMRQVFDSYKEVSEGKEIEELIESEFSGNLKEAYLALVKIFKNVADFYAEMLRKAIKGAGTDDSTLIQIIVTRSEIDLKDIMEIYESKYESNLVEDIVSDTSGDYKLILEKLLTLPQNDGDEEAAVAVEEEITAKTVEDDEAAPPEENEETKTGDEAEEVAEENASAPAEDGEEAPEGGDEAAEGGEDEEKADEENGEGEQAKEEEDKAEDAVEEGTEAVENVEEEKAEEDGGDGEENKEAEEGENAEADEAEKEEESKDGEEAKEGEETEGDGNAEDAEEKSTAE